MGDGPQYVDDAFDGPDGTPQNQFYWTRTINADTTFELKTNQSYFYSNQTTLINNTATLSSNYKLRGPCEVTVDVGVLSFDYPEDPIESNHYIGVFFFVSSSKNVATTITANFQDRTYFMISDGGVAGFEYEKDTTALSGKLTLGRDATGSIYGIFPGETTKKYLSTTNITEDVTVKLVCTQRDAKLWEGYHDNYVKTFGEVVWPEEETYTDLNYAIVDDWKEPTEYKKAYKPESDRYFQKARNGLLVRNSHRETKYGRSYQVRFQSNNKFTLYGYQTEIEVAHDD